MKKLISIVAAAAGVLVIGSTLWIRAQAASVKPGDPLPPLSLTYLREKPDLERKPLLVEFWATWCPPCRRSIPHLNEVYARYHQAGLEVVGITDEDAPTVEKFQQELPMQYPVAVQAPRQLYARFGVKGIPQAFLVDRQGKVVWSGHPLELTEEDVNGALH
jgi:thiol-disulfide isomerase/thioredoxin